MRKTQIYIVRHGESQDNANGVLGYRRNMPLTKKGEKQVEKLAKLIKKEKLNFDCVFVSPLTRAQETAEILKKKIGFGSELKIVEDLIERDGGEADGCSKKEVTLFFPGKVLKSKWGVIVLDVPGSEKIVKLMTRARRVLKWIKKEHAGERVLLICHGDFGQAMFAAFYKKSWLSVLKMFHFGNAQMLILEEKKSMKSAKKFLEK